MCRISLISRFLNHLHYEKVLSFIFFTRLTEESVCRGTHNNKHIHVNVIFLVQMQVILVKK